jgi:hypothetical protein
MSSKAANRSCHQVAGNYCRFRQAAASLARQKSDEMAENFIMLLI